MTDLLIAFVIPILVIIVSIVLETILRCPFKVAGIIFVLLIIAALVLGATLTNIILAWFYTLLAFITALVVERIYSICTNNNNNSNNNGCGCNNQNSGCRCRR